MIDLAQNPYVIVGTAILAITALSCSIYIFMKTADQDEKNNV